MRRQLPKSIVFGILLLPLAAVAAEPPRRLEFTRMVAHWDAYADPGYLPFIEAAQPELVQLGFYGAHFWSLAHTPAGKGYPAHFPVVGLRECGQWFADRNKELHTRGVKVVGHMNVKFLIGDPESKEGPRGFFKFYRDLWDESLLGPKPVADPMLLLERDRDGQPRVNRSYSVGGMSEYWGCLNNPAWRQVLKAWSKRGLEQGVDGFVANYFYRHDCHCEHCVRDFKQYLRERYPLAAELRDRFAIQDLDTHVFPEIVAWHNPQESTPLRREMLRFSQIANKRAFDEVFVQYGRSLRPDLIVAQWNHLGNFSQISGDERCLLPAELWGRDEDYLWYSTGNAAHYTDLAEGHLGEGTLQARYIRGAFDDKPFTLGKYEGTRIRVAIAELAANGGAPMGFYARFTDPEARQEIVRYYQFLKRHDELFRASRPHAEAVLLFPRKQVHAGHVDAVKQFRDTGTQWLNQHVLFDVLPDDLVETPSGKTTLTARGYAVVASVTPDSVSAAPPADGSRFKAPATVRISASRPASGSDLVLHFVNYNRDEPAKKHSAGSGLRDERPIAVGPHEIAADVRLPNDVEKVGGVTVLTPESPEPKPLAFTVNSGRLAFKLPEFLVYCVVRVRSM